MERIPRVGLVGWRGMVGSVLMERMRAEGDFASPHTPLDPVFFSTSQGGGKAPAEARSTRTLQDAHVLDALGQMDVILSCQGGDYTRAIYPPLRATGWRGDWIDAASTLRMDAASVIVLDPVNRALIDRHLAAGGRDFIGGNCTNAILLMGLNGLFDAGLVEWVSSMTYQAASGAGAQNMRELLAQMETIAAVSRPALADPARSILEIERQVRETLRTPDFPSEQFGAPLAGSLIPWIDAQLDNGQSKEEWKGRAEVNKIMGYEGTAQIPVDGLCVRIGALRCHSLALTLKLRRDVPLAEIETLIRGGNRWVRWIPNRREDSVRELTPAAITGQLDVAVGRVRKLALGGGDGEGCYLSAFVCGDQLLWGAAEPLRRMLGILLAWRRQYPAATERAAAH